MKHTQSHSVGSARHRNCLASGSASWARAARSIGGVLLAGLASIASAAGDMTVAPATADEALRTSGRLVKDGVVVEFSAKPASGATRDLVEGEIAEVKFKLTDEASGQPLRSITPAAWMDIGEVIRGQEGAAQKSCKDKIALYLKGVVGIRPMVDLNSYFVLVLNREPSVTVIDPVVSMAGTTSTYANIPIRQPGADWTKSITLKSLYISMPKANEVAVIDVDSFRLRTSVPAGANPTRVALQPDGRRLWVGNDGAGAAESGVTVLDAQSLERLGFVATGAGHHEIAFGGDGRHAFVTNREAGTVTIVDAKTLHKVRDVATGPLPLSIAHSSSSGGVYVADGKDGSVTVIDPDRLDAVRRIPLASSLGPMRFSPDGRWGFVLDTADSKVHILDASSNDVIHTVAVEPQPFQLTFSRAYAYVRALGSERVNMINLSSIGRGSQPIVQAFAAGTGAPKLAPDLVLADSISAASTEAAVMIVNPVDNTTYFYMEGMNATASNYKSYGYQARAVTVVDRSLKEIEPGVYQSNVRMPTAGRYDVAFLLESPRLLHCFTTSVAANPAIAKSPSTMQIEFLTADPVAPAGQSYTVRFRLTNAQTGAPRTGLADVRVMSFLAPGRNRSETPAVEIGDGVYEAKLQLADPGAYYVHAAVPSARVRYTDLPFTTIRVGPEPRRAVAPAAAPRS